MLYLKVDYLTIKIKTAYLSVKIQIAYPPSPYHNFILYHYIMSSVVDTTLQTKPSLTRTSVGRIGQPSYVTQPRTNVAKTKTDVVIAPNFLYKRRFY